MKKLIVAAMALGTMIVISGAPAEAQPRPRGYYDDLGQFRGQLWCFRRDFYTQDCNYYTYEQCMATASGLRGFCQQNPWSFHQAQQEPQRPKKRKIRRHHR